MYKENQICTFSRGGIYHRFYHCCRCQSRPLRTTMLMGFCVPWYYYKPLNSWIDLPWNAWIENILDFLCSMTKLCQPTAENFLWLSEHNNPDHPGTVVLYSSDKFPVVGIAGDSGFTTSICLSTLWTVKSGFGRKVLQILEDLNIGWEHMPWYRWPIYHLRSRELISKKKYS